MMLFANPSASHLCLLRLGGVIVKLSKVPPQSALADGDPSMPNTCRNLSCRLGQRLMPTSLLLVPLHLIGRKCITLSYRSLEHNPTRPKGVILLASLMCSIGNGVRRMLPCRTRCHSGSSSPRRLAWLPAKAIRCCLRLHACLSDRTCDVS